MFVFSPQSYFSIHGETLTQWPLKMAAQSESIITIHEHLLPSEKATSFSKSCQAVWMTHPLKQPDLAVLKKSLSRVCHRRS